MPIFTVPYAFYSELRPNTCSIIYDLSQFTFNDKKWLQSRIKIANGAINIYEMHFGSWKMKSSKEAVQSMPNTMEEDEIIPHSQKMGQVQHTVFCVLAEAALCPIKIEIMEPSLESLFLKVVM